MTINFIKGSEKQRAWAQDIIDAAYRNLDNMDKYIEQMKQLDPEDPEKVAGYTHEKVNEVRKMLDSVCEKVVKGDATTVINMREKFEYDRLYRTLKLIQRDDMAWDAETCKYIKRQEQKGDKK